MWAILSVKSEKTFLLNDIQPSLLPPSILIHFFKVLKMFRKKVVSQLFFRFHKGKVANESWLRKLKIFGLSRKKFRVDKKVHLKSWKNRLFFLWKPDSETVTSASREPPGLTWGINPKRLGFEFFETQTKFGFLNPKSNFFYVQKFSIYIVDNFIEWCYHNFFLSGNFFYFDSKQFQTFETWSLLRRVIQDVLHIVMSDRPKLRIVYKVSNIENKRCITMPKLFNTSTIMWVKIFYCRELKFRTQCYLL